MNTRFSVASAILAAGMAVPGAGHAQNATSNMTMSDEDRRDALCILTTDARADRAMERMAFFFGRISARNSGARFTPTLNAAMPAFRELDKARQDALSRQCQEEFTAAFG